MRLTDLLIADRVLDQDVVDEILRVHGIYGGQLDTSLLESGLLDERQLQPYLERTYNISNHVDVFGEAAPDALRLLRKDQAETYRIVPMRLHMRALEVLISDPTNVRALDEVAFITGCRLVVNVASEARVADHLQRWYQIAMPERLKSVLSGASARKAEMDLFMAKRRAVRDAVAQDPARRPTGRPAPQPSGIPEAEESSARQEFGQMPTVEMKDTSPIGNWLASATPSSGSNPRIDLPPPASLVSSSPASSSAPRPRPAGLSSAHSTGVRRSYDQLAAQLRSTTDAEEVPPVVMPYLGTLLSRVILFVVQRDHMRGWDARGPRLRKEVVEPLRVSLTKPSVFQTVLTSARGYHGPLPQDDVEEDLMIRLSGPWPEHTLILPIRIRDRSVALIYGEAADGDALAKAHEPAGVITDLLREAFERLHSPSR